MNNPYEPPKDISSFDADFGRGEGGKLTLAQIFLALKGEFRERCIGWRRSSPTFRSWCMHFSPALLRL